MPKFITDNIEISSNEVNSDEENQIQKIYFRNFKLGAGTFYPKIEEKHKQMFVFRLELEI